VLSNNTRESLQSAHRALLWKFRERRPEGDGGWDEWDEGATARYVCAEAGFHIKMGVLKDWKTDELLLTLIDEVAGVMPEGLQTAACDYVGQTKLLELAAIAEATGDQWKATIRKFSAYRNKWTVDGPSPALIVMIDSALSACKAVPADSPESMSGLRAAFEYIMYYKFLVAGDVTLYLSKRHAMKRLVEENRHNDFETFAGEYTQVIRCVDELFPAITVGNVVACAKSIADVITTFNDILATDPGVGKERRLGNIRMLLNSPILLNFMYLYVLVFGTPSVLPWHIALQTLPT
jgi:hypothetical protein